METSQLSISSSKETGDSRFPIIPKSTPSTFGNWTEPCSQTILYCQQQLYETDSIGQRVLEPASGN